MSTSTLNQGTGMAAPSSMNARALLVIALASAAWAFSFGLGAPLASLWLRDEGRDFATIGLNTGLYYLGIALAAGFIPFLMRRWGPNCVIFGCFVSGLTVVIFPWCDFLEAYFSVRFINGLAAAMTLIPLETYVNRDSPPEHRSRNFAVYAVAITVGWALGNFVGLKLYDHSPFLAFTLGGASAVLAGMVISGWLPRLVAREEQGGKAAINVGSSFLSLGTAWCQGFLEGGMVAFLALYLRELGMSMERIEWLTSLIMIGIILFQVPVAWLADRFGRTRILLFCYAVVIAGLCLLPFCGDSIWLTTWLFLVGACSGAFYPLGLAILGEKIPDSALARANAWFLASNCIGSLIGPHIMGEVMDWFGKEAMYFAGLTAVVMVLVSWLTLRATLKKQTTGATCEENPSQPHNAAA